MADYPVYAALDLGGTKIAGILAGADGQIIVQKTIPTEAHAGVQDVIDRMVELVHDLAEQSAAVPTAVGVGVPGWVDIETGMVKFLPNLPSHWRNVPLRETLMANLCCPVYVINDARMAALGEWVYGLKQAVRTMLLVTLGTGIGGGMIINGELYLGGQGANAEIGHTTVLPNGPACICGNRGCLENSCKWPRYSCARDVPGKLWTGAQALCIGRP